MRRRIQFAFVAGALAALLLSAPRSSGGKPGRGKPFFDARKHQTRYAGPGRESADAVDVKEVLIGYFGPSDPDDPVGGDMWLAAQLAVEQANASCGYRGKPFRLVPAWSETPWGTGVSKLVRMVYRQRIWAIVGGIDGPSTHLAEQVVAKARLALISPVSTDRSANLANVPWVFSLCPGDHLTAGPLAAEIARRAGRKGPVLVSADDHDSRVFTGELKKALTMRRVGLQYQVEFRRGTKPSGQFVTQILAARPPVVVIAAGAEDSARMLGALRGGGYGGDIFGGPAMGRRVVAGARDAARGVTFPLLYNPSQMSEAGKFSEAFRRKCGRTPDYAAAHTHDALQMLIAAIRKAGLNRARIRDAVGALSPWTGLTGTVHWDGLGSNTRTAPLCTIEDGRMRTIPIAPHSRRPKPASGPGL